MSEICIEIDHPKNADVYFYPANQSVRSRIYPSRSGAGIPSVATEFMLTGIPGQKIHLDAKAKRGWITDGLAEPENEKLYAKMQEKFAQAKPVPIPCGPPVKTVEFNNLSAEDVQTWLYWMARIVDGRGVYRNVETGETAPCAKVVTGTLPPIDQILATGKVKRPKYHNDYKGEQFYEAPQQAEPVGAGK